ncbi:MAG: pyrophosphohydrolase [Jatrophihabitantaceae bacterium]|nr:pyrophosphohydrolase [Jatrophihabitantaceae bacterium]
MQGDGDGWVRCAMGHTHWGKYGAAGVMIRRDGQTVLQHRAPWTHEGGTWAVPGGARDSHEDAVTTALREADEEADIDPTWVRPLGAWITDHDGWAYATILAEPVGEMRLSSANPESLDMRWWEDDLIGEMALHSGFALSWAVLAPLPSPMTIVVDAANVMGARPDGWWTDRLAGARRLRDGLRDTVRLGISARDALAPVTPLHLIFPRVVLVVEGEAAPLALEIPVDEPGPKPAFRPSFTIKGPRVAPWWERAVEVVAAPGSGDSEVIAQAQLALAGGEHVVVVSADRELQRLAGALGGEDTAQALPSGPSWLWAHIDSAMSAP